MTRLYRLHALQADVSWELPKQHSRGRRGAGGTSADLQHGQVTYKIQNLKDLHTCSELLRLYESPLNTAWAALVQCLLPGEGGIF